MTTSISLRDLSMAELALQYPNAVSVFNKYHLDYCCGGKVGFAQVCDQANLNIDDLEKEIVSGPAPTSAHLDFVRWSPALLADYIQEQHHTYVRAAIPVIEELLIKVVSKHGEKYKELVNIQERFLTLAKELTSHMRKEEDILFPAIKRQGSQRSNALQMPIHVMEDEHETAGNLIKAIRELSRYYQPPQGACTAFQVLYQRLEEFDRDLMRHVHLENNVLFEKVLEA